MKSLKRWVPVGFDEATNHNSFKLVVLKISSLNSNLKHTPGTLAWWSFIWSNVLENVKKAVDPIALKFFHTYTLGAQYTAHGEMLEMTVSPYTISQDFRNITQPEARLPPVRRLVRALQSVLPTPRGGSSQPRDNITS